MPKRTLAERILDADVRGSTYLADANEAREKGDVALAVKYEEKGQFWLDRYNLLTGKGERPAPKL